MQRGRLDGEQQSGFAPVTGVIVPGEVDAQIVVKVKFSGMRAMPSRGNSLNEQYFLWRCIFVKRKELFESSETSPPFFYCGSSYQQENEDWIRTRNCCQPLSHLTFEPSSTLGQSSLFFWRCNIDLSRIQQNLKFSSRIVLSFIMKIKLKSYCYVFLRLRSYLWPKKSL